MLNIGSLVRIKTPYWNKTIWGCLAMVTQIKSKNEYVVSIIGFDHKIHSTAPHNDRNEYHVFMGNDDVNGRNDAEIYGSLPYYLKKLKDA